MRTAEQVVNEIHSALGDGDKQGLRNTAALLEALQAWPACPVIHVAGTNGKGSVCAMLSRILTEAGYRTGLYTSPFLQSYRERIRLNGVPVTEETLARYGEETLNTAERLREEKGYHPTPFELGTALAFRIFRAEKAEVIVAETGMGGRLDPTNAIPKPAVCGITAIGMDHMQYLGNTPEEIAREKAGIIKPGVPVVCSPTDDDTVAEVLKRTAAERGAPLVQMRKEQIRIRETAPRYTVADFETEGGTRRGIRLSLPGEHQALNALTVLGITEELRKQGVDVPEEAVVRGLADTFWPGRLEWCGNVLMDGAHNEQGAAAFRRFTETLPAGQRVLLTGVLREKLSGGMLRELSAAAGEAVTVTPDSPRAMPAEELKGLLEQNGVKARAAGTVREGLAEAKRLAGADGTVLATGSLYFIGTLRNELGLRP